MWCLWKESLLPHITNTLLHSHVLNSLRVTAASEADGLSLRYCKCPRTLGTRPSPFDGACPFQRAVTMVSTPESESAFMAPVKSAF